MLTCLAAAGVRSVRLLLADAGLGPDAYAGRLVGRFGIRLRRAGGRLAANRGGGVELTTAVDGGRRLAYRPDAWQTFDPPPTGDAA